MNEIAKTQSTQVAVPQAVRPGFETPCQREDLIIPRAKLFQGLPTEYEDYPDAKPGQLLNNITKEVLPSVFIPIMRHIEWIRFNPRDAKDPNFDKAFNPGEVVWRSTDPNDPRVLAESTWGVNGEKPIALKFLSFLSYFPGSSMPIMLSFFKTSFNAGKTVNSVLEYSKGAMYEHRFKISTKMTKSEQYSYYVLQTAYNGKATAADLEEAKRLYESFKSVNIKTKDEYTD
jgi:hypothetical protein